MNGYTYLTMEAKRELIIFKTGNRVLFLTVIKNEQSTLAN